MSFLTNPLKSGGPALLVALCLSSCLAKPLRSSARRGDRLDSARVETQQVEIVEQSGVIRTGPEDGNVPDVAGDGTDAAVDLGVPTIALSGRVLVRATKEAPDPAVPVVVYAVPRVEPDRVGPEEPPASVPSEPALIVDRGGGATSPQFMVTSVGREVQFENRDQICHGYFSSSEANTFDPEILDPGESRTVELLSPGPVEIYCSLHSGKQMSLFVSPTPYHVQPETDGSFVIADLDAGEYEIHVWADGLPVDELLVERTDSPDPLLEPGAGEPIEEVE